MKNNISYSPEVIKYLKKTYKKDKKIYYLILSTLQEIIEDPYNSDLLKGIPKNRRKKRKGDYRIIFRIQKNDTMRIIKIGHRKNIYKT